jgi:hexosaminidase
MGAVASVLKVPTRMMRVKIPNVRSRLLCTHIAIAASHPELMTDCGSKGPSEPLDATSEAVYDFISSLYHEITGLFEDSWIHVGGDEVPLQCWQESPQIQRWMKEHGMERPVDLLAYFETKLLRLVSNNLGRRPVVWQELFDLGVPLPQETVVDVWMSSHLETVQQATEQGYDVIVSACWYLDDLKRYWGDLYECDPRNFLINATDAQHSQVLGGHASMWGEGVDETNFMPRVWPRASSGMCLCHELDSLLPL